MTLILVKKMVWLIDLVVYVERKGIIMINNIKKVSVLVF